ncbi:MAG TPA: DUF4345 family protein [Myxococcota bacterium]|nr:DUF4345 family protein [Myxococcota bacterium]
MRLARFAAAWSGGILALFGALYVLATERMLAFAELTSLTPTALTDLRVMYGALQLAPGFFCLASLRRAEWLEPALGLATFTFALIPALRILGIALDGTANQYHLTALVIELGTLALTAFAWRGLRRSH